MIIWDIIGRCSKRRKRGERVAESSGDFEASPAPSPKPPRNSWFLWLVPNMFSKYRGIPNRADTPDSAMHDAFGETDDEDIKKYDLHREKSKVSVRSSSASEISIPLPPHESIAYSPSVSVHPK